MSEHEPDWLPDARVELAHLPTPLEPLDRLSEELGGPRIWLKRDDCTGLATGGNKTRKLEYLLAEAEAEGAKDVITYGAVQSNHARQTAAACARRGLRCHMLLTRSVQWSSPAYEHSGNPLLGRISGAEVHIVDAEAARDASRDLRASLPEAYVIPAGGSNATGALGYVRCALELDEQCTAFGIAPTTVVHASSSAGTQAGLIYGFARAGSNLSSLGVNVYHDDGAVLEERVRGLTDELAARHGPAATMRFRFEHRYRGEAYGIPTEAAVSAIRLAAELEGVFFDPVYSGKALGALVDLISVGELSDAADIVLLHTGGAVALAVYDTAFS